MTFEKSLSISVDMEDEINEEARILALSLLNGLTIRTPVDTGRARGNWFVSTSKPNREIKEDRRSAEAISDGSQKIDNAKSIEYPSITLSNNLPYIERLNDGHSLQAPKKFVEIEIDRVVKAVNARLK